jgi:hypothetical protein
MHPEACYRVQPIFLNFSDKVSTLEMAKDAIGLLRDRSFSDPGPFDEVQVTDSTVTVRGFRTSVAIQNGVGIAYRIGDLPVAQSYSKTKVTDGADQQSIWLADILQINVERCQYYPVPKNDYDSPVLGREGFVCELVMRNSHRFQFWTSEESYARRVAAGFAFLSNKAVTSDLDIPSAGFVPSNDQPTVFVELIGGPFDQANIPLNAEIRKIDGHSFDGPELYSALRRLAPGTHTVEYKDIKPLTFVETTKFIIPPPAPVLNIGGQ